jgi:hypothetical protein
MQPHLIEIDHPSLVESIDERFDNITNLMSPNSLVYGSALTSLISGLASNGDLDIAVSSMEYSSMASNLADSTKWIQIEGAAIRESSHGFGRGTIALSSGPTSKKSKYKDSSMPIGRVVAFESVTGHKVQIMQSKSDTGDPLEDALNIIRNVDFSFCGMAMDRYGRLLESIPHAFSDCIAQVIRIANYRAETSPDRMKSRLNKYLKRGWQLSIAYDQVLKNLKATEPKPKKPKRFAPGAPSKLCKVVIRGGRNVVSIHPKVIAYLPKTMLELRISEAFSYANVEGPSFIRGKNSLILDSQNFVVAKGAARKAADAVNQHLDNRYDLINKIFKRKKPKPEKASWYEAKSKPEVATYHYTGTSTSSNF